MAPSAPMTVVETQRFLQDAQALMPELEREEFVVFIATNPEAGKIVPEAGGVRKLRWALPGLQEMDLRELRVHLVEVLVLHRPLEVRVVDGVYLTGHDSLEDFPVNEDPPAIVPVYRFENVSILPEGV
jgi:hypothetical protein